MRKWIAMVTMGRSFRMVAYALTLILNAAVCLAQQPSHDGDRLANSASRTIALTFDDLPMTVVGNDHIAGPLAETRYINTSMLRVMKAHHATSLGLVNEVKLNVKGERDARARILEDWLDAGMLLGNHGYSHVQFSNTTLAGYEEEFLRGDVITAPMLQAHGLSQRYFRHPYLDTGGGSPDKKKGFDSFLAAHGYRVAPFTIQDEDWMFNASYDEARRKHDVPGMARVRSAYLEHISNVFAFAEELSRSSFHREVPEVMFMHTDILNADVLDAVLTLMEKRGYHFVSFDQVLQDPAYATPDEYMGNDGISWLDRWQLALGRALPTGEPKPPAWIQANYKRITAH